MEAFGSYQNHTVLDFTKLKSDLFLITGSTGAGKTTIFDAIIFALYGTFSGSEREARDMHSDAVSKSKDMQVKLSFIHHDKEYTVRRWLHFPKVRGREDVYGDPRPDAELQRPDGRAVKGAKAVSEACSEIIGLNAVQFKEIAMLAQGEFTRFLTASQEEKAEILSTLFDVSLYRRYQDLLINTFNHLKAERQKTEAQLLSLHDSLQLPTDLSEEEKAALHPDQREYLNTLDSLIQRENILRTQTEKKQSETNRLYALKLREEGKAAGDNKLLEQREQEEKRYASLMAEKQMMEAQQKELREAENAIHNVLPFANADQQKAEALAANRREIQTLALQLQKASEKLAEAQKTSQNDPSIKEKIIKLKHEIAVLKDSLSSYHALQQMDSQIEALNKTASAHKKQAAQLKQKQEKTEQTLNEVKKEIDAHQNAPEHLLQAETQQKDAAKQAEALKEIMTAVQSNAKTALTLQEKEKAHEAASKAAGAAVSSYNSMYQHFIAAQAGFLGANLEEVLSTEGHAVCPVCHTAFTKEEAHDFARPGDEAPDRSSVDAMKQKMDEAVKKERESAESAEALRIRLEENEKAAVKAMQGYHACAGYDELTDTVLPAFQRETEARRKETAENYQNAFKEKEAYEAACRKRDALEAQQEKQRHESEAVQNAMHETETELAALTSKRQTLAHTLLYEDETEVRAVILQKTAEAEQKEKLIKAHEEAVQKCLDAVHQMDGSLAARRKDEPVLEQQKKDSENALKKALQENHFATLADAAEWFDHTESWLKKQQQKQTDYITALQTNQTNLKRLQKDTAGLVQKDLEAMKKECDALKKEMDERSEAIRVMQNRIDNHVSVHDKAQQILKKLNDTQAVYLRMEKLAGLAEGTSGSGGKLSFERYVLGWVFREVLARANRRLATMSGGRYEMRHKIDADRSNAQAGFNIVLLDHYSGCERAASTISGGESFEVSLSLALGLSDAVQAHAGANRLDTLFVDEGFGTLDDDRLDHAIETLQSLTEGRRLVGVISHVDKLKEAIAVQVQVTSDQEHGSRIQVVQP
jgi:DNA repair exonuclease SbcCD ATPase subunit